MANFKAQTVSLQVIEDFLKSLQEKWDSQNNGSTGWIYLNLKTLFNGSIFIIDSLDESIKFVEGLFEDGKDKKTIVMTLINKLFDTVIVGNLPIWLKPFAPVLKKLVVDLLLNYLVDFIVNKYNEGIWGNKEEQKVFA